MNLLKTIFTDPWFVIYTSLFLLGVYFYHKTKKRIKMSRVIKNKDCLLCYYSLPREMRSSEVQRESGNSGFMEEKLLHSILNLMVHETENFESKYKIILNKECSYVLHGIYDHIEKEILLKWDDKQWQVKTRFYKLENVLREGNIFLYFAFREK